MTLYFLFFWGLIINKRVAEYKIYGFLLARRNFNEVKRVLFIQTENL